VRRAIRDFGEFFEGGRSISSGIFSGSVSRVSSSLWIVARSFSWAGPEVDCDLWSSMKMACLSLHLAHWKSSMYSVDRTPSIQSERVVELC
jgi:hypothetical protein